MNVWSAVSVADRPADELTGWAVFDLPDGDRHLAGWSVGEREGRATNAVVEFDSKQLRAVTSSGRVYQLRGRPGLGGDAEYVWRRWCSINNVDPSQCRDVSHELV